MNISIQVDKSLFTGNTQPGGNGNLNPQLNQPSNHGSGMMLGTAAMNPSPRGARALEFNSGSSFSFGQAASMPRQGGFLTPSNNGGGIGANQSLVQVNTINAPMLKPAQVTINGGSTGGSGQTVSLPPLSNQRILGGPSNSGILQPSDMNGNNIISDRPSVNCEQYQVNVTITKVGNTLIQSRVDISKREIEEQDELILHSNRDRRFSSLERQAQPQYQQIMNNQQLIVSNNQSIHMADYQSAMDRSQNDQNNKSDSFELKKREQEAALALEREKRDEKYKKYDSHSLFIFSSRNKIRQLIIDLVRWKYYDYFMILSILGNSICLAMTDYTDDGNQTEWNQFLDKVDQGFTVIYATEAVLKILAFGFVFH